MTLITYQLSTGRTLAMLAVCAIRPCMIKRLAAITPAMGRMGLEVVFQLLHQPSLGEHFTGQVVLRSGHVVALGHMGDRQGQTTTLLIAMAQLTSPMQIRSADTIHLQTAELGMQADHRLTGHQQPDILLGEAEQ